MGDQSWLIAGIVLGHDDGRLHVTMSGERMLDFFGFDPIAL
jgi:hypothetical protein